jgi:hypothetical protein
MGERMDAPIKVTSPAGYQTDANTNEWEIKATLTKDVALKIPAGDFQTVKVELLGTRRVDFSRATAETGRFQMSAWYSAETRRVVRIEHKAWYGNASLASDELVELLEFSGL